MMAPSSTHTVSHSAEASDPQSTLVHSRNLSTVSSVTLHTNTTLHSQPYEPLLRSMTPSSAEYYDAGSQPPKDSEQSLQWSAPIVPLNTSLLREKSHSDSRGGSATPLTRTLMRQWSRRLLQTVISLWSIYSTVRYLLAFTIYQSITGQVISLLLGAATGLSFAFGACGSVVTLSQSTLLMNGISVHAISVIRITLYYLASACLLGSSVANVALLIIYKRTPDLELQTRYRCKLDVDLIWSTSDSICNRRRWTWGSWITLSALRLVITLAVVIAFHLLVSSSQSAPVRRTAKSRYAKSKKSHNRFESCEAPLIHNRSRPSVVLPQVSHDHTSQRQGSESTLSAKSSPRNRLRTTRSRDSPVSEEYPGHVPHNTPSGSLPVSDEDLPDSERDFNGFIDRFRQLISQVTHETEEALRFARSHESMSQTASDSSSKSSDINIDVEDRQHLYPYGDDDDGDDFYSNPAAHVVQPYDYDQNYPADEHVRMMNGYIRRMPTIESVGSRELHSTIGGASMQDHAGGSRPPTRNTMASWVATSDISGSEPRSRPTSLSAQAELLAGMFGRINTTEVGELFRGETVRMIDSSRQQQSTNEEGLTVPVPGEGYASTTASSQESRESIASSFHTASSGSGRSQASGMSLRTALADTIATPLPMVSHSSPLRHVMTKEESES